MLTYVFHSASLGLLLATGTVIGSPLRSRSPYAIKDSHNVPSMWNEVGPAPADKLMNLHIGLKQGQFDELERHLYEGIISRAIIAEDMGFKDSD